MPNINRNATSHIARVRIKGAQKYQRSFRRREDAAAWANEIEALVRACAAPNPNGPALDRVAADYARHHPRLWRNPAQQSALADLRRRFGRLAITTIVSADIAAWVADGRASGADTAAVDVLLDLLQSIFSHAQSLMKTRLPIGNPVRVWRQRDAALAADVAPMTAISPNADASASSVARVLQDLDEMDIFIESGFRAMMGAGSAGTRSARPERSRPTPADVVDVQSRTVARPAEAATKQPLLDLVVAGLRIRCDVDGLYCLNDLHRAAGGEKRHQPSDFLKTQQAVDLARLLHAPHPEIPGIPGIEKTKSKQRLGTYVAKELVYAYAMWVSPRFHLEVIRAYDAMVCASPFANGGGSADSLRDLPALVAAAVAQALADRPRIPGFADPLLVDTATAARMLGVSASTLARDRRRDGGVPCVRIGSRALYSPDALRAWVARPIGAEAD